MIVDTSALFAILLNEPEETAFADMIVRHPSSMSAGTWIEASAVRTRRFPRMPAEQPERLRSRLGIEIMPMTLNQALIGHDAYRMYGIGSGHSARLNLGDCFSYALAKETGRPLLFKGDDFVHTDIVPALRSSG